MRSSIVLAGTLGIVATAWILSGQLSEVDKSAAADANRSKEADVGKPVVSVRVRTLQARMKQDALILNGRTEASRKVIVRAQTAGPITAIHAAEGRFVEANDIIARQNVEDRTARLNESTALLKQRQIEYQAATKLAKKGFRSEAKLADARAKLDAARAKTRSVRVDISRTSIKAPFRGVLETRYVERGDYVKIGDQIASIVDLDPILAVGSASEQEVGSIKLGKTGMVTFIGGKVVKGKIRYIASVADPDTRSFRIELEIDNADRGILAGLTSKLSLPKPPVRAHVLSPAVLTLADDGRIGVRTVDNTDIVRFRRVSILTQSLDGVWVSGLVDGEKLITVGHEYVRAGQKVRPIAEGTVTGS
ncbi:MAG: efflux transporter periplasmic adaptor subunit [Rhodospirillaceae bacterium]|nr:efflux transporter periplasmic adaptor subunit [Rhodospirillaceae bacterium]|tara:strand:- start:71 stop:1159 length:1089 start_codon:yes stop_codon:yes gene_type:complete